jgi:hypothetical protein
MLKFYVINIGYGMTRENPSTGRKLFQKNEKKEGVNMKRLVSLLLSAAILLSLASFIPAMAAGGDTATINGLSTLSVPDYDGTAADMAAWLDSQMAPVTVTVSNGTSIAAYALMNYGRDARYGSILSTVDKMALYNSSALSYFLAVAAIPEGAEPDMQTMGLSGIMVNSSISYPANAMNLTGGHGRCKLVFLLYKVSGGSFGQTFELIQQWSGGGFQADATKIIFEGIRDDTVYVPQGSDYDLLAGITAHDEKGTPVDVFIADDGGFTTSGTGSSNLFNVVYGAVDPRNNEAASESQVFEIKAAGVYFNVYGHPSDDTNVNAYCETLGTESMTGVYQKVFKADDTLPDRLRSYFWAADGSMIDPELVVLTSDGGYTPDVAKTTVFKLSYEADSVTGGQPVKKVVTVTVYPTTWMISMVLSASTSTVVKFLSTNTEEQNTLTYTQSTGDTGFWLYQWLQAVQGEQAVKALAANNGLNWISRNLVGGTSDIYESYGISYSAYNANSYSASYNFSMSSGYNAQATPTLMGKAFDLNVDDGGFDINKPGDYTITLTLTKDGETKVKGLIKVKLEGAAAGEGVAFTGMDDAAVIQGSDTDLMAGVGAKSLQGAALDVAVKDDGGFDKDKAGNYTVTYAAMLNGKEYTDTKLFRVLANAPERGDNSVSLTLDPINAFGTDPENFTLGKANQELLTMLLKYVGDIYSFGRTVSVKIPYGFELVQPLPAATMAALKPVVTGGYDQADGTTFTYTIPDSAEAEITLQFRTKVHLELLYPGLSAAGNSYTFTASANVNAYPVETSSLTMDANRGAGTPEFAVDISDNDLIWTPTNLFGTPLDSSGSSGARAYQITVTKTPGVLSSPDWNMTYTLPEGLKANEPVMYLMTFYDKDGAVLGKITGDNTSVLANGQNMTLNFFNDSRYKFNSVGSAGTYMDLNEKTARVEVQFYFNAYPTAADKDNLKINITEDLSAAADQGDMIGSEVSINQTGRDGSGAVQVKSDGKITIRLVSPVKNIQLRDRADSAGLTDLSVFSGGTGTYKSFLFDTGGDYGPGVAVRNSSVTTLWPYEYSPVSMTNYDSRLLNVTYTVSNRDGVVPGKENLTYRTMFILAEGEYVSSTTVTNTGRDKTFISSGNSRGTGNDSPACLTINAPTFSCVASSTHLDGTPLPAKTTVQLKLSGTSDQMTTPITAVKNIIISAGSYNMQIVPYDLSGNTQTIGNSEWRINGIDYEHAPTAITFDVKTNDQTAAYEDAALYVVGDAVAMADPSFIKVENDKEANYFAPDYIKVLAYSIDPKATAAGGGTWVTDPYKLAVANLSHYRNLGGTLTGVKLDLSKLAKPSPYKGSSVTDLETYCISIYSQLLANTSEGFAKVMQPELQKNGKVSLPFELGFTTGSTGTSVYNGKAVGLAELTSIGGRTGTFCLGAYITGLVQGGNDYFVQPYVDEASYDPAMDLVRMHYTYTPDAATGSSEFGVHNNAVLLLESNGSPKQNALLSLVSGVSQIEAGGPSGWAKTGSVYYKTAGSDEWVQASVTTMKGYEYYNFNLTPDQYVTAVKVEYTSVVNAGGELEPVNFAVNRSIARTTKTGYTITDGEQLPFNLTFSYVNWNGDPVALKLSGVSSKLSVTGDKLLNRFTPAVSYDSGSTANPSSVYQSENTTAAVSVPFNFTVETSRMGMDSLETYNKLQPVVYYVLANNVTFISGAGTDGNNVTFAAYPQADGTTVVKATYRSLVAADNKPNTKVTMKLNVGYGMNVGEQSLITKAYFDIPYEELNSSTERNYGISIAPNSQQLATLPAAWSFITKGDANDKCLVADISGTAFVIMKKELGLLMNPTTTKEDGSLVTGDYETPACGTAADNFGAVTTMMGDAKASSTDWNLYIPIAKKDATVEYLDIVKGKRAVSAPSEFNMSLSGPVDISSFPAGTTVTYTTGVFNPAQSALVGAPDSAAFAAADQITDWSKVTAVHINIPDMDVGRVGTLKLAYDRVAKTEIGTQTDYSSMYYNYKVNGVPRFSGSVPYAVTTAVQYDLTDMYISGRVWEDASHNSLYDSKDAPWPNMVMKVSGVDAAGKVIKTYEQTLAVESADSNLKGTTGADGGYTLAVPGYGTYVVEFAVPEAVTTVTKQAAGGTVNNQSVFNPTGKTDVLTMDKTVEGHHMYNRNAGLYKVVMKAQSFSYGADEANPITEEQAKQLAFAGVSDVNGNPVDLSSIKLGPDQLKAFNDSLAAGKLGKFPLTFTYTYDDGGTPDDPGDDKTVTNTVQVTLKDHGKGEVQQEDRLTADDASYGIDNGAATAAGLRKLLHAEGVSKDGRVYLPAQIIVNETDLKAMNDALTGGTAKPGDRFAIRLTSPGGVEVTSIVTLREKGTIASTLDYITADSFDYGKDEPALTEDTLKALSHVTGRDADGFPYEPGELALKDASQLTAINKALKSAAAGSRYPVTYVTPEGTSVTVYVTIKDKGAQKQGEHITANNFSYPVTAGELTPEKAKELARAAAVYGSGSPIDIERISADQAQLKAINDALSAARNGTKLPLTFTTPGGASVTIEVTLTKNEVTPGIADLFTSEHILYMAGYPDGMVKPGNSITRAEVAVVIYRLMTDEAREANRQTTTAYSDVAAGKWYTAAVATLSRAGIICGYPDGSFRPDNPITRAEFAAMFAKFNSVEYTGKDKFSDISGHWAESTINRAAAKGWVGGFEDGTFRPDGELTRAQAATMINQVLCRLPESVSDLIQSGMKTFPDNMDTTAWYYLAIQEAANGHSYILKSDHLHETWKAILAPDAGSR